MAERFTRIYSLDGMRFTPSSPVLIVAGALLADAYSGELLCQLRLRSLSAKCIKAVTATVQMLNIAGLPMGRALRHNYLDLELHRDDEFGRDTAIVLPSREARAFTVAVTKVVYADNSIWELPANAEWETLPQPKTLEDAYFDPQLAEQFRIRYGGDCRDMPYQTDKLWFCTCGATNRQDEGICWRCRRVRSALLDVNTDALRQEVASRLRQEEAQEVVVKAENKKLLFRRLKVLAIIVPLVILAIGLAMTIPGYVRQKQAYDGAVTLLAAGRYEDAAQAFEALGSYRDSAEQLEKNVPYQQAVYIVSRARENDASVLSSVGRSRNELSDTVTPAMLLYEEAIARFEALDGYKESESYIRLCREGIEEEKEALVQANYDEALALLEEKEYSLARESFLALGDFSDSAEQAREAVYQKLQGFCSFILQYDVRQIYADLSFSSDRGTVISLPKSVAFDQGNQCITDLRQACGKDLVDVNLADTPPAGLRPLSKCVTELLGELGDYKDSAELLAQVLDATDYTKDFYMLIEAGDVYGASDWLRSYDGDFAERDRWLSLLEFYKPFCASWSLYGGDPTAIPLTVGRNGSCNYFSTRVILSLDRAILRISANDGEEYFLDLYAPAGETSFTNEDSEYYMYYAMIGATGHFSYLQYYKNGGIRTSCEYTRA